MGGLGERDGQSCPVPFFAVDLDGNGALRSGWWTVRRWAISTVQREGGIAQLGNQLAPPTAPICSVQTLPLLSTPRPPTKKPCQACLAFQLGELYAHRTAHRICRQRRQSGRSSSLSYFFSLLSCLSGTPFFLQVTSPTSRIDAFENNARPPQTAATPGQLIPEGVRIKEKPSYCLSRRLVLSPSDRIK